MINIKTSFDLPEELLNDLRLFNKRHPERPIVMSAVCINALRKALKDAESKE